MEPQETPTANPAFSFSEKLYIFKNRYISKKTVGIAIALIIAVNIPFALYLSQQRQNVKQHASTNGNIAIIDATTNLPITETTTPDVKLQILLPETWELQQSTPSSRLNIIPKAYAQTATPSATLTPTTPPDPTSTPSATQTPSPTVAIQPSETPTATPSATLSPTASPSATPTRYVISIIISNAENGDGDQPRTITGQEIISALTNPIPWKLNSLLPSETSAQRKVQIQFIDTNNTVASASAEITLSQSQTNPTPSATPSATIDILDYFISKHQDKGLTGTHPLSQVIDGQRAYYMKWQKAGDPTGKSSIFEVYTWDNDNIYLKEDHSGAPVNFYTFAPGTWMKRHMQIGEKITSSSNTIQWYDPTCNAVAPNNQSFPIEVTLERKDLQYDLGEDLGKQDVIIVKYDSAPTSTTGIFERFYYSKEWGWVKWEEYNKATNTVNNTSTFNKISQTPPLQPHLPAACTPEFRTPNPSASPSITPTISTTPATSPTATPVTSPIPTMTLMPTPTIPAGNTAFTIKVGLQGIGKGGNETPVNPQRAFNVMLFDSNGVGIGSTAPNAILTFNPATKLFEGQADMGKPSPGNYTVKAKTDKFLTKVISNILPIVAGTTNYTFPTIPTLVAGDLNNDNLLNIEDFNMYKECLGKNTADCVTKVDLNNDGKTDTVLPVSMFLDYRLLISNFSLQKGD